MAKAKRRKASKTSAKRSAKKRKPAPKRKVAKARRSKPRRAKPPKETSIIEKVTGAVHEAADLRRKLEGPNTFED
jgi:hypothetical protein